MSTLSEFITKYDGHVIGDGQCGTLVRQYAIEVQGITPISYPSAKDYWFNPVPGYTQVSPPQPGDWAIYDAHGTFTDGHMAVYVDGRVFEQNADPDGSGAHLFSRANTYLLGYLRKEGGNMPIPANATIIDLAFQIGFSQPATAEEKTNPQYLADVEFLLQTVLNNNLEFRTKAVNFDQVQAQLTALQSTPAAQQIEQIKKIVDSGQE